MTSRWGSMTDVLSCVAVLLKGGSGWMSKREKVRVARRSTWMRSQIPA